MSWENLNLGNLPGAFWIAMVVIIFVFFLVLTIVRSQKESEQATPAGQTSPVQHKEELEEDKKGEKEKDEDQPPPVVGQTYPIIEEGEIKESFLVTEFDEDDGPVGTLVITLPPGAEPVGIQRSFTDEYRADAQELCVTYKQGGRLKTYTWDLTRKDDDWPTINGYTIAIAEIEVEVAT